MNMSQKTLGIIGGLGPIPTAYLALMLANYTDVKKDQEHINLLIHSYPSTPDRTAYILGKSQESPLPTILRTGKTLCENGADLLAIPCVTSHYFYQEMTRAFPVPVVNMLEETAVEVVNQNATSVGIMATTGTISTGLFQNAFHQKGINSIVPDKEDQERVMYLIYDCVKAGKPIDLACFQAVYRHLKERGAQKVILGCTELAAVNMGDHPQENTVCALSVLAKACLRKLNVPLK